MVDGGEAYRDARGCSCCAVAKTPAALLGDAFAGGEGDGVVRTVVGGESLSEADSIVVVEVIVGLVWQFDQSYSFPHNWTVMSSSSRMGELNVTAIRHTSLLSNSDS